MTDIRTGDRVSHTRRPTMIGEVDHVKGNWAKVYRSRRHHAAGNVNWVPVAELKRHNRRR